MILFESATQVFMFVMIGVDKKPVGCCNGMLLREALICRESSTNSCPVNVPGS